jgi:hypothetical protein
MMQLMDKKMPTDGRFTSRCTILGGYFQQAIGVDLKRCNQLRLTARHGWDASKLEFAKQTVVAALSPFTFVAVIWR